MRRIKKTRKIRKDKKQLERLRYELKLQEQSARRKKTRKVKKGGNINVIREVIYKQSDFPITFGGENRDLSGNSKEHLEIILEWINNDKKFGLIRPGDGEYNILIDNNIKVSDNWEFKKGGILKNDLTNSLKKNLPNLYIGISCDCCIMGKEIQEFYKNTIQLPESRKTYANIFVNANYNRFIEFMKSYNKPIYYVGPGKKESDEIKVKDRFNIDKYLVNNWNEQHEIVTNQLVDWVSKIKDSLIVFSAGPITKVWIPLLLEKYPNNIYLDVGSSLGAYLDESPNLRLYQTNITSVDAQKVCNFNTS